MVAVVVESRMMEAVDSAEEGSAGLVILTMGRCISRHVVVSDGLPAMDSEPSAWIAES